MSWRHKFGGTKYRSTPTIVDGIRFSSKREARHYSELLLAKASGDLLYFLRQVPFHLPGGVRYVCDFCEVWKGGEIRFTEVKGHPTQAWLIKQRLVEALYPVKITVVK